MGEAIECKVFPRIDLYLELHYVPDPLVRSLALEKSHNSNGLLLGQSKPSLENSVLTGFQQFPKVAHSGITRKKAATGATYKQPDFSLLLMAPDSSAAAGRGSEGRRGWGLMQELR